MKAIILAAGKGERLLAPHQPKPLTVMENGKSLLEMQLENFSKRREIHEITIVIGYHKEQILERFLEYTTVENPHYAEENTAKSLLRAFEMIDEDVLWANGDVLFHPSVLDPLLSAKQSAMLVNKTSVGEEEVKYALDKEGYISEVSKQVNSPKGEALGLNLFKKEDLSTLKQNLKRCSENDYFEKGVELSIEEGVRVQPITVPVNHCIEVDFPEDIKRANDLLRSW